MCVAATALSLSFASSADAKPAVHVSCGETITTDAKLANDLTDCPGNGIVIGANDITLDLNGHTIDGDGAGAGNDAGVDNRGGYDRVTITNGSAREFEVGFFVAEASANRLRDVSAAENGVVGIVIADATDVRIQRGTVATSAAAGIKIVDAADVRVEKTRSTANGESGIAVLHSESVRITESALSDNTTGIGIESSPRTHAERNALLDNQAEGVLVREGSEHTVVGQNSVSGSFVGVFLDIGSAHTLVTKNSVHDNIVGGITMVGSDDNAIVQNSVAANGTGSEGGGIGVLAFPDEPGLTSDGNLISKNTLLANDPDGILVDAGQSGNVIQDNRSSESGDDGIDVESPATTLTKNTANDNFDLGIEAVPGVTDGGGNKASGNGDPLQCTNVFCG